MTVLRGIEALERERLLLSAEDGETTLRAPEELEQLAARARKTGKQQAGEPGPRLPSREKILEVARNSRVLANSTPAKNARKRIRSQAPR